jgi:hypothetical protein
MKKTLITALFIALFLSVSWSQQGFVHDSSKEYDRPSEKIFGKSWIDGRI